MSDFNHNGAGSNGGGTTNFYGSVTIVNGTPGRAARSLIVQERRSWIGLRLLMAYLNTRRSLNALTRRVEVLEKRPVPAPVTCNHQCTPCTCEHNENNKPRRFWRVLFGILGALVGAGLVLSEAFIRANGVVFNRFGESLYEVTDMPVLVLICLAAMYMVGTVGYAIGKQIDILFHRQEN